MADHMIIASLIYSNKHPRMPIQIESQTGILPESSNPFISLLMPAVLLETLASIYKISCCWRMEYFNRNCNV